MIQSEELQYWYQEAQEAYQHTDNGISVGIV